MHIQKITEWLQKKTGGITFRIYEGTALEERASKVQSLVVYRGRKDFKEFQVYEDVARDFI
jgi:hypothetical protein